MNDGRIEVVTAALASFKHPKKLDCLHYWQHGPCCAPELIHMLTAFLGISSKSIRNNRTSQVSTGKAMPRICVFSMLTNSSAFNMNEF